VLRYYCDHCSKGMFRRHDMRQHEATCVHNPNRVCWACQEFELDPDPLPKLIEIARQIRIENQDLSPLAKAAQDCPACMLAAIVQARKAVEPEDAVWVAFNYKERMQEQYQEKNERFEARVGGCR
jgi:hypothetical protein